jgi:predicted O-methyltransferase YrrM
VGSGGPVTPARSRPRSATALDAVAKPAKGWHHDPMEQAADPFAKVRAATLAHRAKHGCGAWPYGNGALLGTLAAAADAKRILELGTALGYTALSFAHAAPNAVVDTVERDAEHVRLARGHIAAAGMDGRVVVHEGDFAEVLPGLQPGYDLAFFDGHTPVPKLHAALHRLLRQRGVLVTANLNHGGTANAVCQALLDPQVWRTAFLDEDRETAISIKL